MSDIAEAIINMLNQGKSPNKTAQALASYLAAERKTGELNKILRKIEELRYEREGRLEVTATAARPLSESVKREIKQLFDAENVIIHEEIDKEIIGGVKVRALDKVADFSVVARLQRLKQGVRQ
jgi:F-type H+-transporting ATPase subunit delta